MAEGVSCLCLTYGRPELLEEAVESFKRQRWDGPKELIVVNDHPEQELVCEDEGGEILIVNLKRRLRTLGEKRNFAAALARYEYLLPWDDDDIHLPWRIEETMKSLPGNQFYKCPQVWLEGSGRLLDEPRHDATIFHGAAAYSRYLFREVRGYRCINGGEDQDFERRVRENPLLNKYWRLTVLPLYRIFMIVRRNHGHYHASAVMDLRVINPRVSAGQYRLRPRWKKDYCAEVRQKVDRLNHLQEMARGAGADR
ncbi:MAG TPA: glycosyltransferase family A protein [Pyrinomonadaceae bacterium]|nr:glycosyltransferase family A protein [Pyrinomonadaceae bacterium]